MGEIDFSNGQPAPSELPNHIIVAAMQRLGEASVQAGAERQGVDLIVSGVSEDNGTSEPLSYGDYTFRFRSELSKFLGRCDTSRGGVGPDPHRLLPTAGVSQALDMLCTMCASPAAGDVVLVESPTYFLASAIFRDHGLEVRGVETDRDGLVPEALRRMYEALLAEGRRAALLYIIPVHHNPTGRTMPEMRRAEIVKLAGTHGTLVVADEVYTMLTYSDESMTPSLATLGKHIVSVASFSKVLAPGLRVGWIEGEPAQLTKLSKWAVIDSGGYVSHFASCVVACALELRLVDYHLQGLRTLYAARCSALVQALRDHLPQQCSITELPRGGFFVWVKLPSGVSSAALLERTTRGPSGVRFKEGGVFSPADATSDCAALDCYMRLCFARLSEVELVEGARRLCAELHVLISEVL